MSQDLARSLAARTDDLNAQYARIEEALARLGLGVDAWIDILVPAGETPYQLGYARLKGAWGLAIRREGQQWPIAHAPRSLRAGAAAHLPRLGVALNTAAEEMTRAVSVATDLVREFADAIERVSQVEKEVKG